MPTNVIVVGEVMPPEIQFEVLDQEAADNDIKQAALRRLEHLRELIQTRSRLRKKETEIPVDDQLNYDFDNKGRIVYRDNIYYLVTSKGSAKQNIFRCLYFTKTKCKVTLKTVDKRLVLITSEHNH